MLYNYIVSAYRNMFKKKVFAFVNIAGLTTGFTVCLFIALYVIYESKYDSFFKDSGRIYRVSLDRIYPDRERLFASSPVTIAPTLRDNYPEIESATRLHRLFFLSEVPIRVEDQTFLEDKFFFADSSFFDVFSFEFIEGQKHLALNGPDKVVITESTAYKYFGDENALNQTIRWDTTSFIVSGVIKDVPGNSHMDFDLLGSIRTIGYLNNAIRTQSWINPWLYTYIKLKEGVDEATMEAQLPGMVEQYGAASMAGMLGEDYAALGHRLDFFLQPIEDIHLHSDLTIELQANSDASYLYILSLIAGFILVISCINYINIATARSAERAKEVGVRKVLGSNRVTLIGQFLAEPIILCLLAFLFSIGLVFLLSDPFYKLVGQSLDLGLIINPAVLSALAVISLLVGVLSGLYPSIVISSVDSANVLKGSYTSSGKGVYLRNGLIALQFFLSIVMISGVLFVGEQMTYMSKKNLGFEKENLLVIRQAGPIGNQLGAFKEEVSKIPGVISVAAANSMPGDFIGSNIFRSANPEVSDLRANLTQWDDDYLETMNMKIIQGRGFSDNYNDSLNIIVNESAAKNLGVNDVIGLQIRSTAGTQEGPLLTVIGVVQDYNFNSLHAEISPLVLTNPQFRNGSGIIAIRLESNTVEMTREEVERTWNKFVPDRAANTSFLNAELEDMYISDRVTAKVFRTFTAVALVLACIGLFGLATYTIQQRTKEIGIRKVLGASQLGILGLLVRNFFKLLLVSLVLSIPLTYWTMNSWLNNFAYHIELSPLVFIKAGLITILLMLIAVSYQAIRIARLNPVDSIRSI